MAGPEVDTVDLRRRCLLLGFIEPHLHLIMNTSANYYLLNLSPIKITTLDKAMKEIKDAIPKSSLGTGLQDMVTIRHGS